MTESNEPITTGSAPQAAPDGATALARACDAIRVARQTVRASAHEHEDNAVSQDARENATRRDWSAACAAQLTIELKRPDIDEAVIGMLRSAMFAPFPG